MTKKTYNDDGTVTQQAMMIHLENKRRHYSKLMLEDIPFADKIKFAAMSSAYYEMQLDILNQDFDLR